MNDRLRRRGLGGLLTLLIGAAACPTIAALVDDPEDPPAIETAYGLELVPDGEGVLATWLEPTPDGAAVRFARWAWSSEAGSELDLGAGLDAPAAGWTDPRTVVQGDDLFANWADRPAVRRLADGSLLAHHLHRIAEGTYAYGVRLSRSTDEGRTWTDHGWLHDDDRAVEHGFVSMRSTPEGVLAVWLDGRAMQPQAAGAGHDHGHGHASGEMSVRAVSLDESFWSADRDPGPATSTLLDPRTCECCDTDLAWTAAGPIVVHRDRAADETRDIAIVRRIDGAWTEPTTVSRDEWRIEGCPVNGPVVAAAGSRVVVAWFTAGPGAGPNEGPNENPNEGGQPRPPRVLAAISDDDGATFSSPLVISESTIGRVDLAMLRGGDAVVGWVDLRPFDTPGLPGLVGTEGAGSLRVRRIRRDGGVGPVQTVAPMDLGRRAGFPRLAVLPPNERTGTAASLFVGWRDESKPGLRCRTMVPPR